MTCLMWFSDAACQGVIAACNRGGPMIAAPSFPAGATPGQRQSGRSSGVEHNLATVGVEGSNPFARSRLHNNFREIQLSSAGRVGYENVQWHIRFQFPSTKNWLFYQLTVAICFA